jgi:hypothetical protein
MRADELALRHLQLRKQTFNAFLSFLCVSFFLCNKGQMLCDYQTAATAATAATG